MRAPLTIAVVVAVVTVSSACAPPLHTRGVIDLSAAADAFTGVTVADGGLHVVNGGALYDVDRHGQTLARHALPLDPRVAAHDVAAVGDGTYVLVEDTEGVVFDPATGALDVRFCVVPSRGGPISKNDAVAVSGTSIWASPRLENPPSYDSPQTTVVSSTLRRYHLDDGVMVDELPLDGAPTITGLAVSHDIVYGVTASHFLRFAGDGTVVDDVAIPDVVEASGLAIDGDTAWVLEGQRLHEYTIEAPLL